MYDHVCGVKPLWNNYLVEQGIEPNSILAGYTVYQYYLDKTNSKTKALKEFLQCTETQLEQMGKNGRKLIEEKYSSQKVAQDMVELYKKVCL